MALSPLARRVARTIRVRGLFARHDRIALGVSGGADSVAMALALAELAAEASWSLAGFIHVHHGLRPAEADADEQFVRALAARLNLACEVRRADVRARAEADGLSVETAARLTRYDAFDAATRVLDATVVATAHTRDDQAETVLLRLFRGAGGRGLSGIRPRRGLYARPLIDCRRRDVVGYLSTLGQSWQDDRTNDDVSIPRNYLRHRVLPAIVERWPGAIAALARLAEVMADDEAFLSVTAAEVRSAVTIADPGGGDVFDVRGLRALPPSLNRRVVRDAIEAAGGAPSFQDIEAVRRMAAADRSVAHLDLAGVAAERRGAALRFVGRTPTELPRVPFQYDLPVPGRVQIRETGAVVQASFKEGASAPEAFGDGVSRAVLQASALSLPLTVRNRRAGDRLRPFGSLGRRKLQDLLTDRKVPRAERDQVLLVVDASGRIVWVVGLTIAEDCRVTAPESGVVILDSKKGTP